MKVAVVLLSILGAVNGFAPRHLPALRPAARVLKSQEAEEVTKELDYTPLDVEVSEFDEWLIKMGAKEDPRIPEDCRVDTMTKIKSAGTAGIVSYALTEGAFWVISIPLAITAVTISTGSVPDTSTQEGMAAVGGYSFAFLTFARTVVPLRIAFALALTPWVDDNIMSRFKKEEDVGEDCEISP
jgi:hypothetical protein